MNARHSSFFRLATALILFAETGCAVQPTLDDVLDEFARLHNEQTSVSCACPETIGAGANFASEQECLDASGSIDDQTLACMKRVLEGTSHAESKDIELIECYNGAIQVGIECKRANLEECSTTASNDCVSAQANGFDMCENAYSSTADQALEAVTSIEALFACT